MKHLQAITRNTKVRIVLAGLIIVLVVAFIIPYASATTYTKGGDSNTGIVRKLIPEAPKVLDKEKSIQAISAKPQRLA